MMSSFNWMNIISVNNSQNNAFEELLCQLAKKEPFENKRNYTKVGNPDGGVECFITLENGDEIGFQAKWFLSSPQASQWNQIEESFKTALEKHPSIVTYYIAIPLDRADPRIDGQQSFMDKWNEKVKRWQNFAKDTYNRDIEFIYWGSSELITLISREENTGLKSFFFGGIDLSAQWFQKQNEHAIADLGPRYTPEINVELEIAENFDAISRNKKFRTKFNDVYHNFMVSYRKFLDHWNFHNEEIEQLIQQLNVLIGHIDAIYQNISFNGIGHINHEEIKQLLQEIKTPAYAISDKLEDLNQEEIKEKNIISSHGYRTATQYDSKIRDFRDYLSNLYTFDELINSSLLKLANTPFMILDGEAGIGKSHLLADVINDRLKDNAHSIFLLGQQFREDKEPWSQIFNLLHLACNKEEFLGALNAKAETNNKRIVLFIDAINEGKGREFWNTFLTGFIKSIKEYEWLGLVLSIRSSYFNLIIPESVFKESLAIPITHFGFDGVEYNASKLFFENYHIEQPSIPLLHPEFSNPLFLKLFCEGLQKKGLTIIPDGYEGISNIIKFFIEGIESKLSKQYRNISSSKFIEKVINLLIPEILNNQVIAFDKGLALVIGLASKYGIGPEILEDLISEGLLTKNLFYDGKDYAENIYFAYERFEDHLKVKYLIDNYVDKDKPLESFKQSNLSIYFEENNAYLYRGIIDAMSIQLPEICNVELLDVVNQNGIIIKGFLNSFLWRKVESITPVVSKSILKNISNEPFQEEIFKILFSTAPNPIHPLNADFLHDYLAPFSMKERDVFFIPLSNKIYTRHDVNPIKRLIDWAWSKEEKSYLSDESVLLTSIALSWLLTSSNRQLRDFVTKALISLLQNRIYVVLELLKKFENINEPYIFERLYAVTFGVVVKKEDAKDLSELGEYLYETIFNHEEVYPHILLRDYAKSTIEYINYLGVDLNIDLKKTKPPYKSYFPNTEDLPTNDYINKFQDRDGNYNQSNLISSMMTEYGGGIYGDFGRYVFGRALYDFECKKDEQIISNYATRKIFEEYGYDGVYFEQAEKYISLVNRDHYDRYHHKIERISKKYQWIAFYDTLARVTDNFKMYDQSSWGSDKEEMQYQGSFEPYVRDIDPTVLLQETKHDRDIDEFSWWNQKHSINWNMENEEWLAHTDDLPNLQRVLEVIDPDSKNWIALNTFPSWDEPTPIGYDKYQLSRKHLWYNIHSYLIPKKEVNFFKKWAKKQDFWNDWMPSAQGHYQMFNREHYWSTTYKFFQQPYYGGSDEWTTIETNYGREEYPYKVALTTEKYYWEEEFDYSKIDSLSFMKPSKFLFDGLNMKYSKNDGEFIDKDGNIICFDASVFSNSHQCLLIRKENFMKLLDENNLTICWTVIGEKQIYTPRSRNEDFLGYMKINGYIYLDNNKIVNESMNITLMDKNRIVTSL